MSRLASILARRRAQAEQKLSTPDDAHELVESGQPARREPCASTEPARAPAPVVERPSAAGSVYRIVALGPDGQPHPHGDAALGLALSLEWPRAQAREILEQTQREIADADDERFVGVELRLELATDPARQSLLDRPLAGAPLAVIDFETTGIDPHECEAIQVAVVHLDLARGAEPTVALLELIRPEGEIPADATRVHGISDGDVARAPRWAEVWPRVMAACEGRIPVAYNAPYDYQVLARELARIGHALPAGLAWGRWLDPLILARRVDKFESGKRLADVARRRGYILDPHGAAGDTVAAGLVLRDLLRDALLGRTDGAGRRREPHLPRAAAEWSVSDFLGWQRGVALVEEAEQIRYLVRQGRSGPYDWTWHRLEGVQPPEIDAPPPRTSSCQSCGASIVWLVTRAGQRMPLDPDVLEVVPDQVVHERRAQDLAYTHPGRRVSICTDGGEQLWGYVEPGAPIRGRESHWSTCPSASRHRSR